MCSCWREVLFSFFKASQNTFPYTPWLNLEEHTNCSLLFSFPLHAGNSLATSFSLQWVHMQFDTLMNLIWIVRKDSFVVGISKHIPHSHGVPTESKEFIIIANSFHQCLKIFCWNLIKNGLNNDWLSVYRLTFYCAMGSFKHLYPWGSSPNHDGRAGNGSVVELLQSSSDFQHFLQAPVHCTTKTKTQALANS